MNEPTEKMPETQGPAVHVARTAWVRAMQKPIVMWLMVGTVAGIFLAFLGALDSYRYGLGFRLTFWLSLCVVGSALGAGIEYALGRLDWTRRPSYLRWTIQIFLFALSMTPIAWLANSLGGARPASELLMYFQNSLVISSAFVGIRLVLGELSRRGAPEPSFDASPERESPFMARLPPALRTATLRALQAEGHYVRAITDRGSELVLFRMKDAIRELDEASGMQVHRSWWVARDSIRGSRSKEGRLWLRLEGDIDVPVSRPNVRRLRDAGWV